MKKAKPFRKKRWIRIRLLKSNTFKRLNCAMLSTEPGKMETDYNPSRLRYRYQNQTRPSTWEISKSGQPYLNPNRENAPRRRILHKTLFQNLPMNDFWVFSRKRPGMWCSKLKVVFWFTSLLFRVDLSWHNDLHPALIWDVCFKRFNTPTHLRFYHRIKLKNS